MSLIFNVLEAAYCSGTHHKLAFHSLKHLTGPNAAKWRKWFLFHQAPFVEGSKVPDKEFKDFKNHVLHVQSGNWGGAATEAEAWYDLTVEELRAENWDKAAFSAGVLSHYVTDPVMPFHTAQSEAETNIHRAVEWSVNKSYNDLRPQIDVAAASSEISTKSATDWLQQAVIEAAQLANLSYDTLIDRYDFKKGSEDPPAGFDQTCREHIARHLGYAQVLQARILDRAIEDAGVTPPKVNLTVRTILAVLTLPLVWVTRKMSDAKEIKIIQAMYREFEQTGRVDKYLTDDVRTIRDLVAAGSKIVDMPKPTSDNGLRSVPSIGTKTAAMLSEIGLNSIQDLLDADPVTVVEQAKRRWLTTELVQDWQDLARISQALPQLRGHDIQILVGGGVRSVEALASLQPEELLANVTPFVESEAGKKVVKPGYEPDVEEVTRWIQLAAKVA